MGHLYWGAHPMTAVHTEIRPPAFFIVQISGPRTVRVASTGAEIRVGDVLKHVENGQVCLVTSCESHRYYPTFLVGIDNDWGATYGSRIDGVVPPLHRILFWLRDRRQVDWHVGETVVVIGNTHLTESPAKAQS